MKQITTDICVVGGGPAGMTAALKFAQYGVSVALVEGAKKYPSTRNFRGETITQQSVGVFENLGILSELKSNNFIETEHIILEQNGSKLLHIDFNDTDFDYQFPIDIPQPILLAAMLAKAKAMPNFQLHTGTVASGLLEEDGAVVGVCARANGEEIEIRSRLTVAADGRFTKLRKLAGIKSVKRNAPKDLVWFKIPRPEFWGNVSKILIKDDRNLIVLPTYPDLLRIGLRITSGGFSELRAGGLEKFYDVVDLFDARLGDIAREEIKSFSELSFLEIFTTEVDDWGRPGFVVIGDAAHTLSPILGQGVNQSILDAVQLAPLVYQELINSIGPISKETISTFQKKRQPQIDFVLNFQNRQEKMINAEGLRWRIIRRAFYGVLGTLPLSKKIMGRKLYYNKDVMSEIIDSDKHIISNVSIPLKAA